MILEQEVLEEIITSQLEKNAKVHHKDMYSLYGFLLYTNKIQKKERKEVLSKFKDITISNLIDTFNYEEKKGRKTPSAEIVVRHSYLEHHVSMLDNKIEFMMVLDDVPGITSEMLRDINEIQSNLEDYYFFTMSWDKEAQITDFEISNCRDIIESLLSTGERYVEQTIKDL